MTKVELMKHIAGAKPFDGSDAGWKAQHGENWQTKKVEAMKEVQTERLRMLVAVAKN